MRTPPLDPEGEALWRRVAATVRPLRERRAAPRARAAPATPPAQAKPDDPASVKPEPVLRMPGTKGLPRAATPPPPPPRPTPNTLDGGWDKKLKRGTVSPDYTIDLHGHTLGGAHAALDAGLSQAVASGARLVLLVTGRPPREGGSRLDSPLRGIIRASVGDWIAASCHAARIAAIRAAHPRHGGAGALYLVLRRPR